MSCAYMYTTCIHACLRGYADHPEDERLHHTIDRTDERFDLWRFIIYISPRKNNVSGFGFFIYLFAHYLILICHR